MLTTFITLFGRFKFLRASYEISSISEHYNCRMDEAFAGLSGFCGIVDDVVIYATHHADHVRQFLQCCADQGITLNTSKWKFSQPKVMSAGFILSGKAIKLTSQSPRQSPSSQRQPTAQTSAPFLGWQTNSRLVQRLNHAPICSPTFPSSSTQRMTSSGQPTTTRHSTLARDC